MILLDTSGLLAALDASQRLHEAAATSLRSAPGPRLLSPFVLAELDYLLATKISQRAALSLIEEVARGAYRLEAFDAADAHRMATVMTQYADLDIGLADASLVVLSERYRTLRLLTLDQRHFRSVRGFDDRPFTILPADS